MPYERNEMAKHLDIYNLAHDDTFRKRVQCAVYLAGRDVLNDGLEKNSARHILARQSQSAAEDPTEVGEVEAGAPDSDLDFVVASVWGEVADS